jgi:hypothetical protein
MRYLRGIFESVVTREEFLDFCETNLAYLVDEGYEIFVKEDRDRSLLFALTIPSDISTEEDYDTGEFKWDDVKDHFIPFLTRLNNKYSVGIAQFFTNRTKTYEYYTIQQMIQDKPTELDCYLYEIEFSIK